MKQTKEFIKAGRALHDYIVDEGKQWAHVQMKYRLAGNYRQFLLLSHIKAAWLSPPHKNFLFSFFSHMNLVNMSFPAIL